MGMGTGISNRSRGGGSCLDRLCGGGGGGSCLKCLCGGGGGCLNRPCGGGPCRNRSSGGGGGGPCLNRSCRGGGCAEPMVGKIKQVRIIPTKQIIFSFFIIFSL